MYSGMWYLTHSFCFTEIYKVYAEFDKYHRKFYDDEQL